MSILHAIVLGIVQGLTEFFPVSSSGHLALVPWLFGWDDFGDNESLAKAFDVALHLGTLVGAVAYFWQDLLRLLAHRTWPCSSGNGPSMAGSPGCWSPPPFRRPSPACCSPPASSSSTTRSG